MRFRCRDLERWLARHLKGDDADAGRKELAVGYQARTAYLWSAVLVKELGFLDAELDLLPARRRPRLRWRNAVHGMELVEGLVKGHVHLVSLGDYPMSVAQRIGQVLPHFCPVVLALDAKAANGHGIGWMRARSAVRAEGPVRLATIAHSSAFWRARHLLQQGPWRGREVELVYQDAEGGSRQLVEGAVQAAVLWEPYPSWMAQRGWGKPEPLPAGPPYLTGIMADQAWVRGQAGMTGWSPAPRAVPRPWPMRWSPGPDGTRSSTGATSMSWPDCKKRGTPACLPEDLGAAIRRMGRRWDPGPLEGEWTGRVL